MPLLSEPVGRSEARLLRRAVLDCARVDHRLRVEPTLCVGTPGGPAGRVVDDPSWDHGLRTEMAGALLRAWSEAAWVWVTRSGPLVAQDVDASWLSAVTAAAAEREVDIAFVAVTRHGWPDPRTGNTREWKRIRQR